MPVGPWYIVQIVGSLWLDPEGWCQDLQIQLACWQCCACGSPHSYCCPIMTVSSKHWAATGVFTLLHVHDIWVMLIHVLSGERCSTARNRSLVRRAGKASLEILYWAFLWLGTVTILYCRIHSGPGKCYLPTSICQSNPSSTTIAFTALSPKQCCFQTSLYRSGVIGWWAHTTALLQIHATGP